MIFRRDPGGIGANYRIRIVDSRGGHKGQGAYRYWRKREKILSSTSPKYKESRGKGISIIQSEGHQKGGKGQVEKKW